MSLTASQKTLRGLIAVAALFFVSIGTMAYLSSKLAKVNASTLQTYQVLCELKDTINALLDVETGNRGYALTLRKEFLEPYKWGIRNTKDHLGALENLLRDPDDTEPLAQLKSIAAEKIAYAGKVTITANASKENGALLVG